MSKQQKKLRTFQDVLDEETQRLASQYGLRPMSAETLAAFEESEANTFQVIFLPRSNKQSEMPKDQDLETKGS